MSINVNHNMRSGGGNNGLLHNIFYNIHFNRDVDNHEGAEMIEADIQRNILRYLSMIDALVFRMNAGKTRYNVKLAPSGTPDLFAVLGDGRCLWIEVKTETGKIRESQYKMIQELENRGQWVIIARDVSDVQRAIRG